MSIKSAAEFSVQNPQVGIYRGVSDEAYFASNAVNHSTLKEIERSPAHFQLARRTVSKTSPAKSLGTLTHMMLFQPSLVSGKIVGPPINPKTQKPYGMDTNAWSDYAAQHPGKLIVTDEQVEASKRMVDSIRSHDQLNVIFGQSSENEVVLVWEHEGIMFKAKVDALRDPILGDLKSTIDASERAFARSIVDWNYHTQASMYKWGAGVLGIPASNYVIGAVESTSFQAAAYELDDQFLRIGEIKLGEWLAKLVECTRDNEWPGYPGGISTISPPNWLLQQFADAEV